MIGILDSIIPTTYHEVDAAHIRRALQTEEAAAPVGKSFRESQPGIYAYLPFNSSVSKREANENGAVYDCVRRVCIALEARFGWVPVLTLEDLRATEQEAELWLRVGLAEEAEGLPVVKSAKRARCKFRFSGQRPNAPYGERLMVKAVSLWLLFSKAYLARRDKGPIMKQTEDTAQSSTPPPAVPKIVGPSKKEPVGFAMPTSTVSYESQKAAPTTSTPTKPAKPWALTDGEEMNRLHPDTFPIPSELARRNVKAGAHVKIWLECPASGGERFWVEVVSKHATPDNYSFIGRVLNQLLHSSDHGIEIGDLVEFRMKNIIDIVPDIELAAKPTMVQGIPLLSITLRDFQVISDRVTGADQEKAKHVAAKVRTTQPALGANVPCDALMRESGSHEALMIWEWLRRICGILEVRHGVVPEVSAASIGKSEKIAKRMLADPETLGRIKRLDAIRSAELMLSTPQKASGTPLTPMPDRVLLKVLTLLIAFSLAVNAQGSPKCKTTLTTKKTDRANTQGNAGS